MQYHNQILRFQDGQRSQNPAPDVTIEHAPQGIPPEAGEQLVVLVDLLPALPRRSRELRTLTAEAYWNSTGSIAGRLRRALSEANRYLVHCNGEAGSAPLTTGSLTCAVFAGEELFLGQVGPANALLYHPNGGLELFPQNARVLAPLGVTLPPVIHIGYAPIEPECIFLILTGPLAGAQSLDRWNDLLSRRVPEEIAEKLATTLGGEHLNGSAVLVHCQTDPIRPAVPEKPARWAILTGRLPLFRRSPPVMVSAAGRPSHPQPAVLKRESPVVPAAIEEKGATPPSIGARLQAGLGSLHLPDLSPKAPSKGAPGLPDTTQAALSSSSGSAEPSLGERLRALTHRIPYPIREIKPDEEGKTDEDEAKEGKVTARTPRADTPPQGNESPETEASSAPSWTASWGARLRAFRLPAFPRLTRRTAPVPHPPAPPSMAERKSLSPSRRALLRQSLRALLPGRTELPTGTAARTLPIEKPALMSGIALGIPLLVLILAFSTYFQYGGLRTLTMLAEARTIKSRAYTSQAIEDWQQLLSLTSQILDLEPANPEAQSLKKDAQIAIDALRSAAVLAPQALLELGAAPAPRHLLVAGSWVYYLNPTTDEVAGLQLDTNGLVVPGATPLVVIKQGQMLGNQPVDRLIDLAWMENNATPDHPDGAVFIYSESGALYIYEPTLGPGSTTRQLLPGDPDNTPLEKAQVTLMDIYGDRIYLIPRQKNQIFTFDPINGLYANRGRNFLAGSLEASPLQLQNVLDIALDDQKRLYILMGDGSVQAYAFDGTPDLSFSWENPADDPFRPTVMAVTTSEDGWIYLGDTQRERIIVLNKHGRILHQFRFPGELLRSMETMAVSSTQPPILYFIAENRLYAAPLPTFTAP